MDNTRSKKVIAEVLQEAAETALAAAKEAERLKKNGVNSIVDAAKGTVESGWNGIKDASSAVKGIADDPRQTFNRAMSKSKEAKESVCEFANRTKDNIVDTYNRREEIHEELVEELKYAYENPDQVVSSVKQHGKELIRGFSGGVIDSAQNLYAHLDIGKEDIEELNRTLQRQSKEFADLKASSNLVKQTVNGSNDFLDALLVGGDVLHQALAQEIPADVLKAYALQYPRLADHDSFREHIIGMSDEARRHLLSSLKGKLFEIRYVDYLNNGHLDDGYSAILTEKANQSGYDIEIHGPDGHLTELIQLKATESIAYVKTALERYPDIPVVSTSEVHSELVLRGYAESVSNGGITNSSLKSDMHDALGAADSHFHGPSELSLALLAFTSYSAEGLTAFERSHQMGERTGSYMVSYCNGVAAHYGLTSLLGDSVTGIPFLSCVVSTVTRTAIGSGKRKIETFNSMDNLVKSNENILGRLRRRLV